MPSEQSSSDDRPLPAECPDCDTVMETRGEALTHMLYALGADDHRAGGTDA